MSEPFTGEIRIFAGNFAPRSWAFCHGTLMDIGQHTALFSLLGTNFGGDGRVNFGLPDIQGRVVVGAGQGVGLTNRPVGHRGGTDNVALSQQQMPTHSHHPHTQTHTSLKACTANGVNHEPNNGDYLAVCYGDETESQGDWYSESDNNLTEIGGVQTSSSTVVHNSGGSTMHYNKQPHLGLHYIIALQGLYPSRP